MTTPEERTRSVVQAAEFLRDLCDSARFQGVPEEVRRQAKRLLRHYPSKSDLDAAAVAWPNTWARTSEAPSKTLSYADLMSRVRFVRSGSNEALAHDSAAAASEGQVDVPGLRMNRPADGT